MSHVETELLAYLDGELSPADAKSVEAHLARCRSCSAALKELQALRAGLSEVVPAAAESVRLSAEAESRIRSALAAERARQARSGSLQNWLADFFLALRGGLRPLTKAAFPALAVFFLIWTVNAARLPLQTGVQQTIVLGQDTFTPGTEAAVRVVVRDGESSQPIANASVNVRLAWLAPSSPAPRTPPARRPSSSASPKNGRATPS